MGELTQYMCLNCDFTIQDNDLRYFIDEKTNCIVIHSMGMRTFDMGRDSKINGKIIPSFCPHCLKEVNFCHNDDMGNVEKIITSLETDEKEFKKEKLMKKNLKKIWMKDIPFEKRLSCLKVPLGRKMSMVNVQSVAGK